MKFLTKLLYRLGLKSPPPKKRKAMKRPLLPARPRTIEDHIHYKIVEKLDDRNVLASVYRKRDPRDRIFIIRKDNGESFRLKFPNHVIQSAMKYRNYRPILDIICTLDQTIL